MWLSELSELRLLESIFSVKILGTSKKALVNDSWCVMSTETVFENCFLKSSYG